MVVLYNSEIDICRSLVEQLSKVDVASMVHEEKLAFWINVYNALMMHVCVCTLSKLKHPHFIALRVLES